MEPNQPNNPNPSTQAMDVIATPNQSGQPKPQQPPTKTDHAPNQPVSKPPKKTSPTPVGAITLALIIGLGLIVLTVYSYLQQP